MPLFLLTPVDRRASEWAFSSTDEPVQVEADTEERARRRANAFFVTAGKSPRKAGRQHTGPPWDQRHLVTARIVDEADPAVRLILAGDTP